MIGLRTDNLSEVSTIKPNLSGEGPTPSTLAATISRNIGASLARVAVVALVALVALVLPAYLTHHLPVKTYAAWVLILQLAAYVSYLDLGIQTAVAKFVAEYDARGDHSPARDAMPVPDLPSWCRPEFWVQFSPPFSHGKSHGRLAPWGLSYSCGGGYSVPPTTSPSLASFQSKWSTSLILRPRNSLPQ